MVLRDRVLALGVATYALMWRYTSVHLFGLDVNPGVLIVGVAFLLPRPAMTQADDDHRAVRVITRGAVAFTALALLQWFLYSTGGAWAQSTLDLASAAVVVFAVSRSADPARLLAAGVMLAGVPAFAIGVWELRTGGHLSGIVATEAAQGGWATGASAFSLFGNPNDFANFCVLFLVVSVVWSARMHGGLGVRRLAPRWVHLVLAVVACWCILTSGSRLAIAVMPFLLTVWFADRVLKGRKALFVVVAGGTLGLMPWFFPQIFPASNDASGLARRGLLESAFCFYGEHPVLGIGATNFPDQVRAGYACVDTFGYVNPHSLVGEVMAEFGTLGLLVLGFMGAYITLRALRSERSSLLGIAAVPLVVVVGSMASTYLASPLQWLLLTALVLSGWRTKNESQHPSRGDALVSRE